MTAPNHPLLNVPWYTSSGGDVMVAVAVAESTPGAGGGSLVSRLREIDEAKEQVRQHLS